MRNPNRHIEVTNTVFKKQFSPNANRSIVHYMMRGRESARNTSLNITSRAIQFHSTDGSGREPSWRVRTYWRWSKDIYLFIKEDHVNSHQLPEAEEGRDDQMGTTTRIKIRAEDLGRHRCFRLCCKKEEVGLILFKQRDFFFFEQRSEISRLRYFYESKRKILDFVFPGISSLQLGRR